MFRKRHPAVGARPGTLAIAKEAVKPRVTLIEYRRDKLNQVDVEDFESLKTALDDSSINWIDVQGFGDRSFFLQLAELFQLHPLLLEDIVNVPQRPKVEAYEDQMLIIVRMVRTTEEDEIDTEQFSVVLGKNYVLTFQERYGDVLDPVRRRIQNPESRMRKAGSDYLAYAIIDTIVDAYYPVLESIGDRLESLEDQVLNQPTPELLNQLHRLKTRLVGLRRAVWPQRESIRSLAREEHSLVSDSVQVYFRDTHDHCIQSSEVTEMYREMVSGLMNTYLSSIANRTNDVMKILTIVSTIFIPLTFVAGIYGMNFKFMPELEFRWAYPLVWVIMLIITAAMLAFFARRGWLGNLVGKDKDK